MVTMYATMDGRSTKAISTMYGHSMNTAIATKNYDLHQCNFYVFLRRNYDYKTLTFFAHYRIS